ncbi:MAG: hypothetical protein JW932_07165 [Deltaproteobacteria bacterium]|nr:hypothetical protein [Deltaproteobacteria bacterium]
MVFYVRNKYDTSLVPNGQIINGLKIVLTVRHAEKPLDSGLRLSACGHAQAGRNDGGVDNDETSNK